jgi:cytochrome c-type biogenesis protein CcmH/NrfG
MAWWSRSKSYDRNRLLADASRARTKGKPKKALALLETVLAQEPSNAELHRRVAPLRAEVRRLADAWTSYRIAVGSLVRAGFLDQAVGVLREASGYLGRERVLWEELANAEQQRGRPIDAVDALLEGRQRFRARRDRPEAIRLLQRARQLAPTHFEANFDLAGLLAQTGSPAEAARILAGLAARARGSELRRTRRRQLFLRPSLAALWRYVRSWIGRR